MEHNPVLSLALTGFGPFGNFRDNPSWKVVQNVAKILVDNKRLRLVCVTELPVVYESISDVVDILHKELTPDLTVHVGLAKGCDMVRVEYQSFNHSYTYEDMDGKIPSGYCVKEGGKPRLMTSLKTEKLIQHTMKRYPSVKCRISGNPGNYACGYCYYTSLCNNTSSLFIHIPDLNEPYSIQQISNALVSIVTAAVHQLQENWNL